MSTYQMVVRSATFRGVNFARLRAGFWTWWVGLYAQAPRKPRPLI